MSDLWRSDLSFLETGGHYREEVCSLTLGSAKEVSENSPRLLLIFQPDPPIKLFSSSTTSEGAFCSNEQATP